MDWRSFPKVPHLLQYVINGNYYGRINVGGKLIRKSLGTSVWSEAKVMLLDFLKDCSGTKQNHVAPVFRDVVELYRAEVAKTRTMKPRSSGYMPKT